MGAMRELLLEIGCEELPPRSVPRALKALASSVEEVLSKGEISTERTEITTLATPRRLIVRVQGIKDQQEDRTEVRRGPAVSSAFTPEGSPTPALQGFCKSVGLSPEEVEVREGFVWAKRSVKGRKASEILSEALPECIKGIPFEKTMRWGTGRLRFARPIRWIVALLDGEVLPFSLEGVKAGNLSRGHRFLAPEEFEVKDWASFLQDLRKRFVEPDPERRKQIIREQAMQVCHGIPWLEEDLVEENAFLTEWPRAIEGEFREEFLVLPAPVLVTAMAKYERFFPVYEKEGSSDGAGEEKKLTHRFISIINNGDEEVVRQGNQWVLNARFNDAKFFFEEDARHSLKEFLERTEGIVFHGKLGSVRQRCERLERLARELARAGNLPEEEVAFCAQSARLAKADLSTGLVSELPALQGIVGGEYARREGYPEPVWRGIFWHYSPPLPPETAGARVAGVVMAADEADRLAGFLGVGEKPRGGNDPYGLRRSTSRWMELEIHWPLWKEGLPWWVRRACEGYREQGFSLLPEERILQELRELMVGRLETLCPQIPYDVRDAVWSASPDQPAWQFLKKAEAVQGISEDVAFVRMAKRARNILVSAEKKGIDIRRLRESPVEERLFESPSEGALWKKAQDLEPRIKRLLEEGNYGEVLSLLRGVAEPLDRFFYDVMVMTEEEKKRDNRLRLLSYVDDLFLSLADFSKIVLEGAGE
jgi:glycyl-tRNA synthetase beta chain